MPFEVTTLSHELLTLEPLRRDHITGFVAAAAGDRETFGYTAVPTPDTAGAYVESFLSRAQAGEVFPFAQLDADGVVGHTSFLGPRYWPDGRLLAIEVGNTWLRARAQGTALNSVSKLLLFGYAFEVAGASRLDIKTDARNDRARAGIAAVGGTFEGVLRNWQPSGAPGEEGRTRNTAMFSITAEEWPAVKHALEQRIAAKRAAAAGRP